MLKDEFLTYNEMGIKNLLELLGKTVDEEGYIVERKNPSQRVLTEDVEELKLSEFAGLKNNSLVFIKSDINHIIKIFDFLVPTNRKPLVHS